MAVQRKNLIYLSITLLLFGAGFGMAFLERVEKVSPGAYRGAYAALGAYRLTHPEEVPRSLAVVDYSKPSWVKRMALIDLTTGKSSYYRVAHGKNSGELYALRFSNTPESNMSSLGLFRSLGAFNGEHGKAIRLEGLDGEMNGNAFTRDIVLHAAGYTGAGTILWNLITFNGPRIGRSNGCFVVSNADIDEVADKLADGGFIYARSNYTVFIDK
ncbi:MAG: murein L,D-transpeptidase catalytic domain family protein [Chlorobiaceae bacterium]